MSSLFRKSVAGVLGGGVLAATLIAAAGPASAYVSPCLTNDNGYGGDLCVHYDGNVTGAYYAWPLNLNWTPGNQLFPHNDNFDGYNKQVYHDAASADNFASNQWAKVCSANNGGGTCVSISPAWHVNDLGSVDNHNQSQWWI